MLFPRPATPRFPHSRRPAGTPVRVSVVALGDVTPTLTITSTTPLSTKQAYAKQGMTYILSQAAQVVKLSLAVAPKLILREEISRLVTTNLNKDLTILAKLSSSIDDIVAGKKRFEPWLDVVKATLSEAAQAWENASNGVLGDIGDAVQPAPPTTWEGVQKAFRDVLALARDFGKTVGDIIKSIVGGAGEAAGSALGNALLVPALVLGGLLLIVRPILGTLAEKSPDLIRAAKPLGGLPARRRGRRGARALGNSSVDKAKSKPGPFREGYLAAKASPNARKYEQWSNPYKDGSQERGQWNMGWHAFVESF